MDYDDPDYKPDLVGLTLQQELSDTRYACNSLNRIQGTRDGNYVYRGTLRSPLDLKDGKLPVRTIIIKYSDEGPQIPPARHEFELLLGNALATKFKPSRGEITTATSPHIYHSDFEKGYQISQDVGLNPPIKYTMFADYISPDSRFTIGRQVGSWLRDFHTWSSAPEQKYLLDALPADDATRQVKWFFTFSLFLEAFDEFPELIRDHEDQVEAVLAPLTKQAFGPWDQLGPNWGLIHGDIWLGNVLPSRTGWQESASPEEPNELVVIDFELSQFWHRSFDLGQAIGDMFEKHLYRGCQDSLGVIEGLIEGYGPVDEDMAYRTAIYVGMHVINWYRRTKSKSIPLDTLKNGLRAGRDFILAVEAKNKAYFLDTPLASMFRPLIEQ